MVLDILRRLIIFLLLCVAQALVLGRIHLLGIATPLPYVWFALTFPVSAPKWATLSWCFLLGLAIDTFANTPGVAAASMTLIAALQPYWVRLFIPDDAPEAFCPSLHNVSLGKYLAYSIPLVLLYCLVYFSVDMFSFFHWQLWLECIGSSFLLTYILLLTIEAVRK